MATFRRKRSKKYRNKNTRRKSRNARKSNIKRRGKKSLRGGGILGSLLKRETPKPVTPEPVTREPVTPKPVELGDIIVEEAKPEARVEIPIPSPENLTKIIRLLDRTRTELNEINRIANEDRTYEVSINTKRIQYLLNRSSEVRKYKMKLESFSRELRPYYDYPYFTQYVEKSIREFQEEYDNSFKEAINEPMVDTSKKTIDTAATTYYEQVDTVLEFIKGLFQSSPPG